METIKTIIVDDESRIRKGIERLVHSVGEEWEIVASFSDGKEAYDAILNQSLTFDLLLTDVRMPEMDGLTLVKELKNHLSFLTIFISGYDDFQYLQSAIREGAVNYILKPIDREQFQKHLNEVKVKILEIQNEEQEWKIMREKASKFEYTEQIQLLSEITWNEDHDISRFDWTGHFPIGAYRLLHISVEHAFSKTKDYTPTEWSSRILEIEKTIEEAVDPLFQLGEGKSWWWRGGKLSYWLLLFQEQRFTDSAFEADTEQLAERIRFLIQRKTPFTASLALGNVFSDLSLLGNIKSQLLTLLEFRMVEGGNQIFQSTRLKNIAEQKSKGITTAILKQIDHVVHHVEHGNKEELIRSLNGFFHELDSLPSPVHIHEAVHYLFVRITNSWMENDGYRQDSELLAEALQTMKNSTTLMHLKEMIKQWTLKVMAKMTSLKNQQNKPIQVAKDWIVNNLNENITIKKIAQQVYMNPNYFCDYFKNQTGETILDYVTNVRLEKAKELLEKTDLKIYDISMSVGYTDTKYFSRLFKQWVGQTPTQFREKYANISIKKYI